MNKYETVDVLQNCTEYKGGYNQGAIDFADWYGRQTTYRKINSEGRWKFCRVDDITEVDIIAEWKKSRTKR